MARAERELEMAFALIVLPRKVFEVQAAKKGRPKARARARPTRTRQTRSTKVG